MKLLFLLTAINCDIRAKVREELHGLVYLVETLDLFMGQAAEEKEFSVSIALENISVRLHLNLILFSGQRCRTDKRSVESPVQPHRSNSPQCHP